MQKKFKKFESYKLQEYKNFYFSTICLPSGYNLNKKNLDKIIKVISNIDKNES